MEKNGGGGDTYLSTRTSFRQAQKLNFVRQLKRVPWWGDSCVQCGSPQQHTHTRIPPTASTVLLFQLVFRCDSGRNYAPPRRRQSAGRRRRRRRAAAATRGRAKMEDHLGTRTAANASKLLLFIPSSKNI